MELNNIEKLIKAVSDSSITNFVYEEENIKLVLEKNMQTQIVSAVGTTPIVSSEAQINNQSLEKEGKVISSILVGVFYSAPRPEEAAFVKIGDTVKKGQIIGIIEAMKLMNEIESDCNGVIEEVLVKDGDMVEYGQPLFRIKEV